MTFKRARARIGERSTTSGAGPWTLGGAFDSSYKSFSSFLSDGDSTQISVVEPGVAFWTGIGTYTAAGNSIAPTTVEETGGTFGAGSKEIFAGSLASSSAFPTDMTAAIVTGGTSTAYTVASFRQYDTLARLAGQLIGFTPHATNGAAPTLNPDGLGAIPLRASPGVNLPAGVCIQGTPYTAVYNASDGAFYLQNFHGDPYGDIPLGAGLDYWGSVTPNSFFAFPVGQAISRTTYASLFSLFGTTYGSGDGSTTFNLPDKRDRASIMLGGGVRISNSYMTSSLGAAGGSQDTSLSTANLPPYTPSATLSIGAVTAPNVSIGSAGGGSANAFTTGPFSAVANMQPALNLSQAPSSITFNPQGGTSQAFVNLQPSIFCNYVMRVI